MRSSILTVALAAFLFSSPAGAYEFALEAVAGCSAGCVPASSCISESSLPTVSTVKRAMGILAASVDMDIQKLLDRHGLHQTVDEVAQLIFDKATAQGVDPILLTVIAWKESKFHPKVQGDHHKGNARSGGMTGVRWDFPGRPTKAQIIGDRGQAALAWTASFLRTNAIKNHGQINLHNYNGGDYEVKVWRLMDSIRRGLMPQPEPRVS